MSDFQLYTSAAYFPKVRAQLLKEIEEVLGYKLSEKPPTPFIRGHFAWFGLDSKAPPFDEAIRALSWFVYADNWNISVTIDTDSYGTPCSPVTSTVQDQMCLFEGEVEDVLRKNPLSEDPRWLLVARIIAFISFMCWKLNWNDPNAEELDRILRDYLLCCE